MQIGDGKRRLDTQSWKDKTPYVDQKGPGSNCISKYANKPHKLAAYARQIGLKTAVWKVNLVFLGLYMMCMDSQSMVCSISM